MKLKKSSKLIYLDHAATTPVDPRVVKAMQPYWSDIFANPSALYKAGIEAKVAVDTARESIAEILNAKSTEIVFTAGGTESNNLAILGIAKSYEAKHGKPGHIITTPIEHHSILHCVDDLKKHGWKITYAKVDTEGFVNVGELKKLVRKDTALITIMYANNEVGTIEPIAEIGAWLAGLNKARFQKKLSRIFFHTDACQAGGALSLNVQHLKIDLLTLNGSKLYGPKQTAILYVRAGTHIEPLLYGGGQEYNLRSGTENVPGIIGLATALVIAQKDANKEANRLKLLQFYFVDRLIKKVRDLHTNGPSITSRKKLTHQKPIKSIIELTRLPNNVNITFKDVEGESLLLYLDSYNIAVSTGSACATSSTDPSHVLLALGKSESEAYSSVRFTLGKSTTKDQLDYVIEVLHDLIPKLRKVSRLH